MCGDFQSSLAISIMIGDTINKAISKNTTGS